MQDSEGYTPCVEGSKTVIYEGQVWRSHRLAWHRKFGSIPEGLCVLRGCGNPSCMNVDHLFLGLPVDARLRGTFPFPGLSPTTASKIWTVEWCANSNSR